MEKRWHQESFILSSLATLYMVISVVPFTKKEEEEEVY